MSVILRCGALLFLLLVTACAGQEANQILTRMAQNRAGFQVVTPVTSGSHYGGSQIVSYVDARNGGRVSLILANQAQPQATSFDTPWVQRELMIMLTSAVRAMSGPETTRLRPGMKFTFGGEDVMRCAPVVLERAGNNLLGVACLALLAQRPANFFLVAPERPDTIRRAEIFYVALRQAAFGQEPGPAQVNSEPDAVPVPEPDVAPVPETPRARRR